MNQQNKRAVNKRYGVALNGRIVYDNTAKVSREIRLQGRIQPLRLGGRFQEYFVVQSYYGHSGFTFSHYDLPFPTRYCIPYVRSGLYQLVICVKGIRVCALHCVCP